MANLSGEIDTQQFIALTLIFSFWLLIVHSSLGNGQRCTGQWATLHWATLHWATDKVVTFIRRDVKNSLLITHYSLLIT
ncbi:MAG: hypothetical protein ACRC2V_25045, partial [Xenococcaceae cyanobacterium]